MSRGYMSNVILFGERLHQLRKQANLQQKDLAAEIGVSANAISMMERGNRETTLEKLVVLAEVFHVSTDYLLGITDDPSRREDPPEEALILYRSLKPEFQKYALEQMKQLAELQKKE